MRLRAGITLVETIVVVAIMMVLMAALSFAISIGTRNETLGAEQGRQLQRRLDFEDRVTQLLESAAVSTDQDDLRTYMVAETKGDTLVTNPASDLGELPDTLTFTAYSPRLPGAFLASTDDFETANETYRPQGGISEYTISPVATGDSGQREGLFLRTQTPSDGDHTQGGLEEVFSDNVLSTGFEFWDGLQWTATWDTTTAGTKRLPSAIRVSYTLVNDPQNTYSFVVRLPSSDVTTDNPAETTSTEGA
ncbi:MAG: prepilin-type N-terminal cleavage/methylation domain-containing protein [Chthonomonas sp.]|nr:prepilin-type N-terminal cleavage/methylation domain-containing protein [Chthonomonas sp.]